MAKDGFEQKIQATDDHPFFVVGKGWKQTVELKEGDLIETDGHGSMKVISLLDENRTDLTYNFTVADFHTYYVTERNVLVHNCGRGKQVGNMINTNGSTNASDIVAKAKDVGFTPTQTENGPLKLVDENGIALVTIKGGSQRAPGSATPHVELKDSNGQRVNPAGDPVTRKSPENHTPIKNDL